LVKVQVVFFHFLFHPLFFSSPTFPIFFFLLHVLLFIFLFKDYFFTYYFIFPFDHLFFLILYHPLLTTVSIAYFFFFCKQFVLLYFTSRKMWIKTERYWKCRKTFPRDSRTRLLHLSSALFPVLLLYCIQICRFKYIENYFFPLRMKLFSWDHLHLVWTGNKNIGSSTTTPHCLKGFVPFGNSSNNIWKWFLVYLVMEFLAITRSHWYVLQILLVSDPDIPYWCIIKSWNWYQLLMGIFFWNQFLL